ncbi:MAG: SlyX family protein [Spirochaetaceae bacterium]
MNDELLQLEIKISYLEDYIGQLNAIVIKQDKKIEQLIESHRVFKEKISLLEENIKEPIDNTPPPHY